MSLLIGFGHITVGKDREDNRYGDEGESSRCNTKLE